MSLERAATNSFEVSNDYRPALPEVVKGDFSLHAHLLEVHNLQGIENLLSWDQQVCMPRAGAFDRASQLEWVTREIHKRMTDQQFVSTIDDLASRLSDFGSDEQVNIRELKRVLDRERKIPEALAAEKARVGALAYSRWLEAREKGNFAAVAPMLERIVELSRREADLLGYSEHPYDALLAGHDVEFSSREIDGIFDELALELVPLLNALKEPAAHAQPSLVGDAASARRGRKFSLEEQQRLIRRVLCDIGFDFEAGRLDDTAHPFQATVGTRDVRITTNYSPFDYLTALFSALHETGHALYEMGLPAQHRGTPLGSALSLAMHESQSRLWENMVGRSVAFCKYLHNLLAEYLPEEHAATTPDSIWRQLNRVTPGLIRVDADEVSYSLHIILRTALEKALIAGELKVSDLPEAWNAMYEKFLGIRPRDNAEGVLQDVHWYGGDFGYFPTYVLGNLYGASIYRTASQAIPDLSMRIERGEFSALNRWLSRNIYEQGMRHQPAELLTKISGESFSARPFVQYLRAKFSLQNSDSKSRAA